jgi:non-specific serine/threonine protein kinase
MRHLLAAALLLTATACASEPDPDGWREKAGAPSARTEVAAGVLDARIWVVGGLTEAGASDEAAVYDPAADDWNNGPEIPEPRHHTGAAGDGERLWVVGGYTDAHDPTDTVWTIEDGTWTDGPKLPEPRAAGALAWDGERLVYAGGVGPNGLAGDVFELRDDRWQRIGALGTPREHLAAATDGDGTTWFLAGRTGGLDTNVTDVDVVTGDDVRKAGDVPTARGGVAGFHAPGRGGCVAGGEAPDGTFAQVECVDADGRVSTLPALRHSRHGLGAAVVDGVAYTLLGGPTPGLSVADVVEALPL